MEFFKERTKIPFMRMKVRAFSFSILLIISSIIAIMYYGVALSLDFTGGTQVELSFPESTSIDKIRSVLQESQQISLQAIGGSKQFLVRIPYSKHSPSQTELRKKIKLRLPYAKITNLTYIGPQIGAALLLDGVNAMAIALLCTMFYIALRFETRFAFSALVALLHDPIITMGVFALFQYEFDIISLAGVLTILGYSLNDTIVVYDRVRENFQQHPNMSCGDIVDLAINDTLSRTIITSGLTLLAVLSLCLFAGQALWGFSLALAIGIVVGTYSSIYVAGALSVVLGLSADHLLGSKQQLTPRLVMEE